MTRLPSSETHVMRGGVPVLKSATVDGTAVNPTVSPQGNRVYGRGTGGQQLGAATSEPAEGQPFTPSSDDWQDPDTNTEASASHQWATTPPGTTRGGAANWNILTTGPKQEMMAKQLADAHTLVQIDGAVVAITAEAPTAVANAVGLSSAAFQSYWSKVNDLTVTFYRLSGRWPMAGYDDAYWAAREQIGHEVWGAGSTPGNNVQS
jgi:hypothetical protein